LHSRHSRAAAEITSMKLSAPKPTRETLPVIAPTATKPSSTSPAVEIFPTGGRKDRHGPWYVPYGRVSGR
jgi:hypothetical protein